MPHAIGKLQGRRWDRVMLGYITDTALDCGDYSRLTLFSLTAIAHLTDYEAIADRTGQNSCAACIGLLEMGRA